ncbi:hypothetical protein [Streptomyces sp. NPDC002619]|uniref:hypothetical protein n=1 Tax=Streptomyces sp. NPDC002619 TaxID=3364655 RepID=UPI0036C13453
MPPIDALLARARLRHHPVPADTIAYEDCTYFDAAADTAPPLLDEPAGDTASADNLGHLCEVVVTTVDPDVLEFLTDQLPEPTGAWLLGCALHLAGVEDGARFWWQYAAGAEHTPAAYCLALYHHARGEDHAAAFWYDQTGLDTASDSDPDTLTGVWASLHHSRYDASSLTALRILSSLTTPGRRPRTQRADAITNFAAHAVTRGYRRHPGVEIPVPGPRFADRIGFILATTPPWTRRITRAFNPALPSRRQKPSSGSYRTRDTAVEPAGG